MTWIAVLRGWWKVLAGAALAVVVALGLRGRRAPTPPQPPGRPDAGQKEYDDARDAADRDLLRRLGDSERRYREAADSLRSAAGREPDGPGDGHGAA